jgi:hypothetical protein
MKKQIKDYSTETASLLGKEAGKAFKDSYNTAKSLQKFQSIINETINEYNYKGNNFKTIYLPVILAMALEKQRKELISRKIRVKVFIENGNRKYLKFISI